MVPLIPKDASGRVVSVALRAATLLFAFCAVTGPVDGGDLPDPFGIYHHDQGMTFPAMFPNRFSLTGENPFGFRESTPHPLGGKENALPGVTAALYRRLCELGGHISCVDVSGSTDEPSSPFAYAIWFSSESPFRDQDLPLLLQFRALMYLSLRHTRVTPKSIPLLKLMRGELHGIDITGLGFGAEHESELRIALVPHFVYSERSVLTNHSLSTLLSVLVEQGLCRRLVIAEDGVLPSQLQELSKLPELSELRFGIRSMPELSLLPVLPKLRVLDLPIDMSREPNLAPLRKYPFLQQLELDVYRAKPGNEFMELREFRELESLRVQATKYDDRDIEAISGILSLRQLRLSAVQRCQVRCRPLARLHHLQSLSFTGVSPQQMESIGELRRLRHLLFLGVDRLSEGQNFSVLKRLENLESLAFVMTPVSSDSIRHISEIKQLRALSIDLTGVKQEDILLLGRLDRLEYLEIAGVTNAILLVPALSSLSKLRILDLRELHSSENRLMLRRLQLMLPSCRIRAHSED